MRRRGLQLWMGVKRIVMKWRLRMERWNKRRKTSGALRRRLKKWRRVNRREKS